MSKQIFEYRGVSDAVYAKVLRDDLDGLEFGPVKDFAGVSEIGKTTESNNEAHYYDNIPAVIISSTGADTLAINTAGIPLDILADITGQYYDAATGMFVEQERDPGDYAFGYRTQKTDGTEVLVWRLKGSFSIPSTTNATQDAGTTANGQTLNYTGISTIHKFTKTGKPAKAVNLDTSGNLVDTSDFFESVQTPDTITSSTVIPVSGVGLAPSESSLVVGDTIQLVSTVYPVNATNKAVTYASSDAEVASVSETGLVTALSAGTATITVTTTDGSKTDTSSITVSEEA